MGRAHNFASGGFSSPSQRCNAPSRVACIRDSLQVRGICPRATSYLLKSWRPGTEKQYSAAWKCFCFRCDRRQTNPLQADLGTVCDFLTEQFGDSKKSYRTINSYRSALSSMLLPVDGCRCAGTLLLLAYLTLSLPLVPIGTDRFYSV